MRYRLPALVALLVALGCHGPRPAPPGLPQSGGDVNALRLHRLDQAARRLGVTGIEVALSCRSEPGAWAWPNGPIHVSRALVDRVDDDELAAALAHELGHLSADGTWLGPLAALEGDANPDAEARADALGCRLLALRGIPPDATVRLLEKLRAAARSPDGALAARVAHARAACAWLSANPSSAAPR